MSGNAVGGNNVFPSLNAIANLFRYIVNDSLNGGAGSINTNLNPDVLTVMNAAIRDLYSDLRNIGDPSLIKDNYILENLPVLNGPEGSASPSPETQVALQYTGFFDGTENWPQWTLPIDCVNPLRLWQRVTDSQTVFVPVPHASDGLTPWMQGEGMGQWEWRQNAIWMNGAIINLDLRLRYTSTYPDYFGSEIDFANTYVPIQNCQNSIAYKMAKHYAVRLSPAQLAAVNAEEMMYTNKLKNETVRAAQSAEISRAEWGAGSGSGIDGTAAQL